MASEFFSEKLEGGTHSGDARRMSNRSRQELEALDRDALISEAESVGVKRARILTRPELVDEILLARTEDRASVKKARGFFGLARDLLFRAVEKGLNLPDAQERYTAPTPRPRTSGEIVPTVTLAEIYAAQGHTDRAVETLRGVLAREPDHAAAQALISRLTDEEYTAPPGPALPPEDGTSAASSQRGQDQDEQASHEPEEIGDESGAAVSIRGYAEDACVALPADGALRVGWRIRERALAHYRQKMPRGHLALRVVVLAPNVTRPRRTMRDVSVSGAEGRTVVSGLPEDVVVRVAVGMLEGAVFMPFAHSPLIQLDGDALVVRTPTGREPLPSDLAAIAR